MQNAILNQKETIVISQAEYENLRKLAFKKNEKFIVKYTKEGILFTASMMFLATLGFLDC